MIKSYIITIDEMDDPNDAVVQVREKMENVELKKNSIGIVTAHSESIHSGVYEAVCDELPFPLAGIASDAQGANDEHGTYLFSVMILTSDDCNFACGKIENIFEHKDSTDVVEKCYLDLKSELGVMPKLALMYSPFNVNRFSGEYINVISSIDPEVPIFGAVSSDVESVVDGNTNGVRTLCGKQALSDSVVIVLVSGDFTPKFFVSTFTDESMLLKNIGTVSKSEKNVLMEINGVEVLDFLSKIGFFADESDADSVSAGLMTSTFVFDCPYENDSTEKLLVSRSPAAASDGKVVCLGYIHEGSKISIAVSTPGVVIESAQKTMQEIGDSECENALIYSCIGRRIGLLNKPMSELEIIKSSLSGKMNYTVAYCGGEISPVLVTSDKAYNHEHNQTLIACVF